MHTHANSNYKYQTQLGGQVSGCMGRCVGDVPSYHKSVNRIELYQLVQCIPFLVCNVYLKLNLTSQL